MSIQKKTNKIIDNESKNITRYLNDIANEKSLTRKEQIELWKDYKVNRNIFARDKLVKSLLKFVAKIAGSYVGKGLSYGDLISEGNIGLIKAIDKYDGTMGYKLSTYAVWWIKQSIYEAIAKRNGLDYESVMEEKISDDFIENKDNDLISSPSLQCNNINSSYIENSDENDNKKELIQLLISNLTAREKLIINDYYGLNGDKPRTLEEIGDDMGLTKERIRQINEKALKKIRYNALINNYSKTI